MQRAWLVCALLSACVASESGNSSPRCDIQGGCDDGLVCYRGFCVDDGQSISPVTGEDAAALLERDAATVDSARPAERDAEQRDASSPEDAAVAMDSAVVKQDAAVVTDGAVVVKDAALVKDAAAVTDAAVLKDAAIRDAGTLRPDAGNCAAVCKPPNQNSSQCKKCVQNATGQEPDALCGKVGGGNAVDQALAEAALTDPFCISLCLGGASMLPTCSPTLAQCTGWKCED